MERAQTEIENAIDYYNSVNQSIRFHFIESIEEAFKSLERNPYYQKRYKDIRSIHLHKFPYSLFFYVEEAYSEVRILSCFHEKLNPVKRPKQ